MKSRGNTGGPTASLWFMAALTLMACWSANRGNASEEWQWVDEIAWVRDAPETSLSPKEQLAKAYAAEKEKEYTEAAQRYYDVVARHPETPDANIALQRLSKCLFEIGYRYSAFKAVEQVIETYPDPDRLAEYRQIQLEIAKKWLDLETRDSALAADYDTEEDLPVIIAMFAAICENDPSGPHTAEAHLLKAECHLMLNEIDLARADYKAVIRKFPESPFVKRAQLGLSVCDEDPDSLTDE